MIESNNKTPLEQAIEDLNFMKSKATDAFSDIVWGMAITILQDVHIDKEKQFLERLKEQNEVVEEMYAEAKMEAGSWIEFKEGNPIPDYDEYVLWAFPDGNCLWDALDKDGNDHIYGGEVDGFVLPRATHYRKIMTPAQVDETFNIK